MHNQALVLTRYPNAESVREHLEFQPFARVERGPWFIYAGAAVLVLSGNDPSFQSLHFPAARIVTPDSQFQETNRVIFHCLHAK